MKVPRNRLSPTLRSGFLISPAMKVTPFQASLENKEPTREAETAAKRTDPPTVIQDPLSTLKDLVLQASAQLAFHISDLAPKVKPNIIRPKRDNILIMVRKVCSVLLSFTPRLLI
ncbi:hypothetical protein D3C85_1201500 [compost metagenome]